VQNCILNGVIDCGVRIAKDSETKRKMTDYCGFLCFGELQICSVGNPVVPTNFPKIMLPTSRTPRSAPDNIFYFPKNNPFGYNYV
jgi:hypothetical protein